MAKKRTVKNITAWCPQCGTSTLRRILNRRKTKEGVRYEVQCSECQAVFLASRSRDLFWKQLRAKYNLSRVEIKEIHRTMMAIVLSHKGTSNPVEMAKKWKRNLNNEARCPRIVKTLDGTYFKIYYIFPPEWSLHYVVTQKEWADLRERIKELNPNWDKCSCRKRCKATSLDEQWEYDDRRCVKHFVEARFVCPGCHWLKTPSWRQKTWLEQEAGTLPISTKSPHVIDCLGWTEAQVEELRKRDMEQHKLEAEEANRIEKEVGMGEATALPWIVDLSALEHYGYSSQEIALYEDKMQEKAAHFVDQLLLETFFFLKKENDKRIR